MGKILAHKSSLFSNLVSFWKLDGNSNDSVGGWNGTDVNMTYPSGRTGLCASFNNSNGNIYNIGELDTYSFIHRTGVFSINFWVKLNSYGVVEKDFLGNGASGGAACFFVLIQSTGNLAIVVGGNPNAVFNYNQSGVFVDNNWHMI
jgi:hypothetical protein